MAERIGHPFGIFSSSKRIARKGMARLIERAAAELGGVDRRVPYFLSQEI